MTTFLDQQVRLLLRCPTCLADLSDTGDRLVCANDDCAQSYPLADGMPVLIDEQRSVFSAAEVLLAGPAVFDGGRRPAWRRALSHRLPEIDCHLGSSEQLRHLRQLLREDCSAPRFVLVVGGAILGPGLEELLDWPGIVVVESDVFPGPRAQLLFDGHDIPFPDETFDAVVAQGVLEHVLDPYRCAAEIARVTRTGGFVYAETPFMQQVHGDRHDFTRFTHLGHRRLFRRFEEVRSGVSIGPGSVVAWSWKYLLVSLCSNSRQRTLAHLVARLTGFFWKWLDRPISSTNGAMAGASEFYFLGRKAADGWTLSDRELLDSYRGISD